ncbi:hypothetical protein B0T20DRAFT_395982 [Sordaria brevicollis]|uniref:Secreted protein n=1 Tax=Sordaria brevicollis TaxID=83679 RepID=A0AAE0P344_SORBR|nr:hypothetical protein B0T20DRAFT_395982 [Sordaria brevicollis]
MFPRFVTPSLLSLLQGCAVCKSHFATGRRPEAQRLVSTAHDPKSFEDTYWSVGRAPTRNSLPEERIPERSGIGLKIGTSNIAPICEECRSTELEPLNGESWSIRFGRGERNINQEKSSEVANVPLIREDETANITSDVVRDNIHPNFYLNKAARKRPSSTAIQSLNTITTPFFPDVPVTPPSTSSGMC